KSRHDRPLRARRSADHGAPAHRARHLQPPAHRHAGDAQGAAARKAARVVRLFRTILRVGVVTEPLGAVDPEALEVVRAIDDRVAALFGRALAIREVDAGSCNGCELEITGLTGPAYDMERFGMHFVASPRHADLLLV